MKTIDIHGKAKTLDNLNIRQLCGVLNLEHVPFLSYAFKLLPTISEMVEYSKGKSQFAPIEREGNVFRNYEHNISFKVINPQFLLDNDD